jgi:dihydrofolate synthase/folylpolyglutamate synthase
MPDAVDYLHRLPRFSGEADEAFKPGLERMEALLEAMGHPHDDLRAVHVAGTNGKGSVASMTAAIASAAGLRTGLHTSPELVHLTDLMRVDGEPVAEAWLDDAVARYRSAFDRIEPSFFEATVALSFRYFADESVDLAVVEVGLGGRLDATNVLDPALAVITSIDLEHTTLLGDTLAEIAREKAGIVKPETPVLTGVTQPEALAAIRDVAAGREATVHVLDEEASWEVRQTGVGGSVVDLQTPMRRLRGLRVALPGAHQHRNAALAVRAAELVLPQAAYDAPVRTGLADVRALAGLRGRLEVVSADPLVVADVAHNPSSLQATLAALTTALRAERGEAPDEDEGAGSEPTWSGRLWVGLGLLRDKDLDGIAGVLARCDAAIRLLPLRLDADRARDPAAIAHAARTAGLDTAAPASVPDALATFSTTAAPRDALLMTGSHKVVAAVLGKE